MMLIEETAIPAEALPLAELRNHLRMGSGFGEDTLQDPVLESFLRASLSAIEARTNKVLLERGFLWSLSKWQGRDSQALPVSPVSALTRLTLVARDGAETELDTTAFVMRPSLQTSEIVAQNGSLPSIPDRGAIDLRFVAGWGSDWASIPPDLAQAVLLLAAHYYEFRSETSLSDGCMPFGVSSLIERYKPRRLSLGGSA